MMAVSLQRGHGVTTVFRSPNAFADPWSCCSACAEAMLSIGLGLLAAAIAIVGARHLQAKLIDADAVAAKTLA